MLREADDEELAEITSIRHRAAVSRRILIPGRDLADRTPLIQSLPGANSETPLYAEDINDELNQIVADLTAIENRCTALLGLHASLVSKHLAVVSRRLAAVATIFPARLFPRWILGAEFRRPHRKHRKGMASVPGPRRRTERGLRYGHSRHAAPSQLELIKKKKKKKKNETLFLFPASAGEPPACLGG